MTKAIRIHAYGGPDVLRFEEIELEPPHAGQVLIRHTAIGINFADIHNRTGRYPLPCLPHILGGEAVGIAEKVGPAVQGIQVGDRVAYATGGPDFPPGAYAEARVVDADRLISLPDTVDDLTAACVMTKGLTAQYLLKSAFPVSHGDTVLLHAASGGVGSLMAQWARHLGCHVIGVVGSPAKVEYALSKGCHEVLIQGVDDIAERARDCSGGEGVSVVYDSVGKDTFEASLRSLRPRGTLVSFGSSSGPVPPFDIFRLNRLGSLHLTSAGFSWFVRTRKELLDRAEDMFAALDSHILRVDAPRCYRLKEARKAHEDLESRATLGASVLIP